MMLSKIEEFKRLTSLTDCDALLCKVMDDLACGHFSYNYYPSNFLQTRVAKHVVCTHQVEGWQAHYATQQYDQVDPILHRLRQDHLPLSWQVEEERVKYDKKRRALFEAALDFGLRGGFAVPLHGPQGEFANLVVQDAAVLDLIKRFPERVYELQLLGFYYHAAVSRLLLRHESIILTERERDCLYWTSQHKSAKEIANQLAISPRTVGFHIENVLKKLKVTNKYQAVTLALTLKLL